uniref:Uncharacterized protein n=1 Tax=Labrus bergylta TaxID=56723 RepID=A0A3Q3EP48_9LABR
VLPKPLFRCNKLKVLCLGNNALTVLPESVGQLVQLTQLELRGNCLDRLPAQLGNCRMLRKSGLVVEDHLFDALPVEVKETPRTSHTYQTRCQPFCIDKNNKNNEPSE